MSEIIASSCHARAFSRIGKRGIQDTIKKQGGDIHTGITDMWCELLALVAGAIFGYLQSGREDLVPLLRQGFFIGIVLGIVLGVLSLLAPGGMSIGAGIVGAIGAAVKVIILVFIFIIGVMIDDVLELRNQQCA
jgi:amino acid transporter